MESSRNGSFEILDVIEKTTYYICIASIDMKNGGTISQYKCVNTVSDFLSTGPIQNLETLTLDNMIMLKWDYPEYEFDRPQGFIINYKNQKQGCESIVINKVFMF